MRIAIIGAGMAGMSCALRLSRSGHEISLFDKGRGPGGRMATRRMEHDGTTLRFDHGAQYFTVRDPRFIAQVEEWESAGVVARWPAAGEDAWVGHPAMNAPLKAMAERLDVSFSVRIEALERAGDSWRLHGEGAPETLFDAAILALPAEQAAPILAPHQAATSATAERTISDPCWTLMAAFVRPVEGLGDTVRGAGPIGWAARNSAKPGRGPQECWVVQASPEWSRAHLEDDATNVGVALLDALAEAADAPLPPVLTMAAHRWRFAKSGSAGLGHVWDCEQNLGVCGDWLIAPRVEAAFLSGITLAEAIGDTA
jgi:hypothetical protein